jgi:acetoin utilization deacetylase AcuC-like enzyme
VLISAGFDAANGDLLGGMKVTPEGYTELTRIVKGIAEESCNGRLVSMLEGGYNTEALAASVEACGWRIANPCASEGGVGSWERKQGRADG